ncbi:TPA: hypothetical protein JA361_08040 [Legionella pneumophila]|nr:hypothetical protein [Legionella pneumophila]HAT8181258.1 hypothetical protein [Legionella pneumophila]
MCDYSATSIFLQTQAITQLLEIRKNLKDLKLKMNCLHAKLVVL